MLKARCWAYYLPQYHPIPENDIWWGKGFTEWTNVTKAKPLFKDHYQPRVPADFGYYDLRVPEVREEQARIAQEYGIEGFIYYHYWFGDGKRILERPFNEILESKKPDFPFCLCWANQSWKGVWFGSESPNMLIEQKYPGKEDYISHFDYLTSAFEDSRYITIDNKPVFHVLVPAEIPDLKLFTDTFRECAHKKGFNGIYLLAGNCSEKWIPEENGFDGKVGAEFSSLRFFTGSLHEKKNIIKRGVNKLRRTFTNDFEVNVEKRTKPIIVEYETAIKFLITKAEISGDYYPCVLPNWDNTARSGNKGIVFHNSTPQLWEAHLLNALDKIKNNPEDKKIIIIKSWNEWAEGNYLEPDAVWGKDYLDVLRRLVK